VPKRFTDTELWKKPWFMHLTPAEKLAWFYIKDECDHVGVWVPNFPLAEFVIGMQLDWDKLVEKSNGNIMVLENGKWWLADFVDFQYGELKETCRPHQTYIRTLKRHGLLEQVKGYPKGIHTLKEKEQEKEKETELEEEQESFHSLPHAQVTAAWFRAYTERTTKTVQPLPEHYSKCKQVMDRGYSTEDMQQAIAWYFDPANCEFPQFDKRAEGFRYNFNSFLANIDTVMSAASGPRRKTAAELVAEVRKERGDDT